MQLSPKLFSPFTKFAVQIFSQLALILLFSLSTKAIAEDLEHKCVQIKAANAGIAFTLNKGVTQIELACNVKENTVLHFTSQAITNATLVTSSETTVKQIRSSDYAFLIPAGYSRFSLNIESELPFTSTASLTDTNEYNVAKWQHSAVMYAFLGFCLALVFYVLIIGYGLRSSSFYHYSIYILTTALFFAVQERIFSVFFDTPPAIQHYYSATILAGLSVYTGQLFVTSLLEFYRHLPKYLYLAIIWLARAVIVLSVSPVMVSDDFGFTIQMALGYSTLTLMLAMFVGIAITVKRQVHCAKLVLLSSFVMISAMMFRIVFADVSEFITRYALIFAVMIDAFILSIAVSQKVKQLYIEKLKAIEKANCDPLCGIFNKRGWYEHAEQLIHKYNVKGGAIALLYIDVDKFKLINDNYSHEVGDKALKHLADVLQQQTHQRDIVGRVGGDEFLVVGALKNHELAAAFVDRLSNKLANMSFQHESIVIEFSASVGYEITTNQVSDLEAMISQSDRKMYQVKHAAHT